MSKNTRSSVKKAQPNLKNLKKVVAKSSKKIIAKKTPKINTKKDNSKVSKKKAISPIKKKAAPKVIPIKQSVKNKIIPTQNVKKQLRQKVAPKVFPTSPPLPTKTKSIAQKDDSKIVKVTKKGGAVVDSKCPNQNKYTVYTYNGKTYDATLNQSNLDHNNNKFYIIQILQLDENPNQLYLWNRWGRVGVDGQFAIKGPFDSTRAISEFESKFNEKTKAGNYVKIEINYDEGAVEEIDKKKDKKNKNKLLKTIKQKFHPKIVELIELIFNTTMMKNQMLEIGYDAKKMPLGKLAKSTIDEGYKVLNQLMIGIKSKQGDTFAKDMSSKFFSLIPHDFGFQKMSNFILNTEEKVKNKLEMLQTLTDMQVATKMIEDSNQNDDVIGSYYNKLECDIEYLDPNSKDFSIIKEYFDNTKGHCNTLKLLEVYKLNKNDDFASDINNRMLLWHGSRLGNYVGILSQGLRIAPPEAPVSGYNLGKGLYFADVLEKSAPYCRSYGQTGLVLLVDVAVGTPNLLYSFNSNAGNLPKGKDSVKACGSREPPAQSYIKHNSVTVPIGKAENTNLKQCVSLNEYVVYTKRQAAFRYLLKVQF